MGLFKNYVNQTRKPEGFLGKMETVKEYPADYYACIDEAKTEMQQKARPELVKYLEILRPENIRDTLHAYQIAKRCNEKRVMYECVKWGERGARLDDIAPGIIVTPLVIDEFNGPRGDFYKNMFAKCPAGRPGTAETSKAEKLYSQSLLWRFFYYFCRYCRISSIISVNRHQHRASIIKESVAWLLKMFLRSKCHKAVCDPAFDLEGSI